MFGNPVNKNYFQGMGKCSQCSKECEKYLFHDKLYLQTPSYYRNKAGGHYYFCSEKCRDLYANAHTCCLCGYDSGLQEHAGKKYCTSNPMNGYSCLDKVTRSKDYTRIKFQKEIDLEDDLKKIESKLQKFKDQFEGSQLAQAKIEKIKGLLDQLRQECESFDPEE